MLQKDAAANSAAQSGWQAAKRADAHAPSAAVAAATEPAACRAGDGSGIRGWGCVNVPSRVDDSEQLATTTSRGKTVHALAPVPCTPPVPSGGSVSGRLLLRLMGLLEAWPDIRLPLHGTWQRLHT